MNVRPTDYEDEDDWDYEHELAYYDESGYIDEQIAKLGHGIYLTKANNAEQE